MKKDRESRQVSINEQDLFKARAAFFNPENAHTSLRSLYSTLLALAETDDKIVSSVNPQVVESLDYIVSSLDQSQRFDEKYLGHMLTEASIPALYAYILALRVGSNTVAEEVSKQETKLEPEAIRWMAELIGYDPEKASGTFTSGGSLANTTALWVAREIASEKAQKPNAKFVVLVNPFVHYSIEKSIRILRGPNRDSIEVVKVGSDNLRMDPEALKRSISAARSAGKDIMAIVSIAGETETGVVDDLNAIADIAEENSIYLHIDAAYGLPYRMSSRKSLFSGIDRANSVTFDPHKALNTPYSAGAVLFKDSEEHSRVNFTSDDAAYVFKEGKASLGQKRIEGSMGAGSILSTVAAIHALSPDQWKAVLDLTLNNIEYLYDILSNSSVLYPVHTPDLNVLCFTLRTQFCQEHGITTGEQIKHIITEAGRSLWEETGFFFSTTDLRVDESITTVEPGEEHQYVFRAVPMNPRTEHWHLKEAIEELEKRILDVTEQTTHSVA